MDLSLVDWSRAQFAMTVLIHWIFVPLTIGMTYIIAMAQTIHVRTGDPEWERLAKFWAKLFGINFAIGVGTGIILGLEFGTNWSNYSWISGDIFGAPLAAEGIMAFFLESSFIAVMFFGWGKIDKKFHLVSCYLVALGATLSALWILTANAWMNFPVGMVFNPDLARHEMVDFWSILLSPFAINKFLHTTASGFVVGSFFIIAVSSWYLLKERHIVFAKRSIILAASFGLLSSLFIAGTGDGSAYQVSQHQPVKLAAMEGLYDGTEAAGLVTLGILNPKKQIGDDNDVFVFRHEIPYALSFLGYRDIHAFVPGINDLVYGNEERNIESANSKIEKGKLALQALANYKDADKNGEEELKAQYLKIFRENEAYMGYGHFDKPETIVPHVPMVFYNFRLMVGTGLLLILLGGLFLYLGMKNKLKNKWLLRAGIFSFPLALLASMAGWIVAEMGRQPWTIQDLLPTMKSVSNINTSSVILTFWMFFIILIALVVAEVSIMLNAIKQGPEEEKGGSND
jgi:cytochrome d ubiquinol oxidase subunit I